MKKKQFKKVISTTLATTMLVVPMSTSMVNALSFKDVKDNHWAKSTIQEFVNKGYIGGYSDNTFKPENSITRAEFIKIVNNVFGYNEITNANFTDVKPGQWYYNDVCRAIKAGYINGYEDKTFRPNKQITREEVAVIITNIKQNKDTNYDKISKYKDLNNISSWAKSSVEGALEAKYLGGYADNTIKPKSNITRAESVATLSRIPVAPPTTPENPLPSKIMYTTGDPIVNIRKGPGTNYEKIGTLPKGSKVEVVQESNGWAKIKFNNGYAYVSIGYLTSGQSQQPLPAVPYTPTNIDSPQHPDIISSAQDVNQNKIQFTINNSLNNTVTSMSAKSVNGGFKVNYSIYYDGSEANASDGSIVQTTGDKSIEAVKMSIENAPSNYHIFYRTKLKGQGWQSWVKDGTISGQIGNDSVVEDIQVRLIISNNANNMVKPKIAVDIGHNVPRPMVRGSLNGAYSEDYMTKSVGEKVIYKLRTKGYDVVNTLPKGRYTQSDELKYRADVANKNKADKFVSIHFNSFNDGVGNGSEVYYSTEEGSSAMAQKVVNNLSNSFGFKNRGKQPQGDLYVLQNTNMPGILVEGCFITNQNDMDKFIAKGEQAYDVMADAIVNGILD